MDEILLGVGQVAELLNFSRSFIYRLIRSETLHALRMGTHLRIRRSEVDRYLRGAAKAARTHAPKPKERIRNAND